MIRARTRARDSNLALSIDLSNYLIQKWCLESAKLAIRPSFCLGLAVSVVDEMFGRIVFGHVPGQVFDTHVRDSSLPLSDDGAVLLFQFIHPLIAPNLPPARVSTWCVCENLSHHSADRAPPSITLSKGGGIVPHLYLVL